MQDEPRKPGKDARKDPINRTSDEADTFEKHLDFINVIQQNAVIMTGQDVERDQPKPDKSNSDRGVHLTTRTGDNSGLWWRKETS